MDYHLHKSLIHLYSVDHESDSISRHVNLQEWDLLLSECCPQIGNRTILVIRFIYQQYQNLDQNSLDLQDMQLFIHRLVHDDFGLDMGLLVVLIKIYMQIIWTGPLFRKDYKMTDQQLESQKQYLNTFINQNPDISGFININDCLVDVFDYIQNRKTSKTEQNHLSRGGEIFKSQYKASLLFILIIELCDYLYKQYHQSQLIISLYQTRLLYIHDVMLETMTDSHFKQIESILDFFYSKVEKCLNLDHKQDQTILSNLLVERGLIMVYYYKYNFSYKCLQDAQQLLGLKLTLTGEMGVKTKYQTFQTAVLVLKTEKENRESEQSIQQSEQQSEQQQSEQQQQNSSPENVQLNIDDDNIFYERPKLEQEINDQILNADDQIVCLGIIDYLKKNYPKDNVLTEQMQAYIDVLVQKSQNWLVFSQVLLRRSENETDSIQKRERSIMQLEALINQFNDRIEDVNANDRLKYVFMLNYPNYIQLNVVMAEWFFKIGSVLSSCQIYERLDLYEEQVKCLAIAGQVEKAKQLAQTQLDQNYNNPHMLLQMGDITQNIQYYKDSWKVSDKKYSKAKVSLGYHYYYQNQYQKSVNAFQKALKLNIFQKGVWFTKGCGHMKLGQYEESAESFKMSINIDENNAEGWANLSNCLLKLNKVSEAFMALEQGVKTSENSWRMWQNLMIISFQNKKFKRFFDSIQKLIALGQIEQINEDVIKKINIVIQYLIDSEYYLTNKNNFQILKTKVDYLYKVMSSKMGQFFYVESCLTDYKHILVEFYKKQSDRKVEMDILLKQIPQNRVSCCQRLMKVGWENDVNVVIRLKEQIQKLMTEYEMGQDSQEIKKLGLFIDQLRPKLQDLSDKFSL